MKKLSIFALSALLLASCSSAVTQPTDTTDVVQAGDAISVNYTGKLEDGTVFDSSRQEDAKLSKNYSEGRVYEPLKFTVGAGQMIPGFDAGVIGMKKWERKTITLAPKDAYGEATRLETLPIRTFQDVIVQDIPKDSFKDVISQKVPLRLLEDKAKTAKIGDEIVFGEMAAKITAIDSESVTLEMNNTVNPFYKKTLKVGLKSEFDGNPVTIKKIWNDAVTIEIQNKQNPFYGKKLAVGLEGVLPNGQKIKIVQISNGTVSVELPNEHELAGKTLIFDIEVVTLDKASKTETEQQILRWDSQSSAAPVSAKE